MYAEQITKPNVNLKLLAVTEDVKCDIIEMEENALSFAKLQKLIENRLSVEEIMHLQSSKRWKTYCSCL